MDINIQRMGQRIRAARKFRKMSAEELSERIGIASESLGHIECGARKPSLNTLYNIALILDVSLDYLSGRTAAPTDMIAQSEITGEELTAEQEIMFKDFVNSIVPIIKKHV